MRGESTVFDREVQEELDMSIPYVGIDNIKMAIKAEREEGGSAPEEDKSLSDWAENTLKICHGSVVERRRQARGLEERNLEKHGRVEEDHRLSQ